MRGPGAESFENTMKASGGGGAVAEKPAAVKATNRRSTRIVFLMVSNSRNSKAQVPKSPHVHSHDSLIIGSNSKHAYRYAGLNGRRRWRNIQAGEIEFIHRIWLETGNQQRIAAKLK